MPAVCRERIARTHPAGRRSMPHRTRILLLSAVCLAVAACNRKQTPAPTGQTSIGEASRTAEAPSPLLPNEPRGGESAPKTLVLPTTFGKRTGDLDEMVKERAIRALVIVNPVGFFYISGRPQGIQFEALQEFEKFANRKLKTGRLPVKIVFLPMRQDQLEPALTQGLGDIIAQGIVVTPEREERVAFSLPIQRNVSHVVVTGTALAGDS